MQQNVSEKQMKAIKSEETPASNVLHLFWLFLIVQLKNHI